MVKLLEMPLVIFGTSRHYPICVKPLPDEFIAYSFSSSPFLFLMEIQSARRVLKTWLSAVTGANGRTIKIKRKFSALTNWGNEKSLCRETEVIDQMRPARYDRHPREMKNGFLTFVIVTRVPVSPSPQGREFYCISI